MTKFEKCLWMVGKFLRNNSLSLNDINERWKQSTDYDGIDIIPRTFYRYKEYIADCFGLELEYSRFTRAYSLNNREAIKNDELFHYLLEAFQVSELKTLSVKHKDKIRLQGISTGVEHLKILLEAIDRKKAVVFDYHSYYTPQPKHYDVIPCFLRMFEGRWYLICELLEDKTQTRVLALERMTNVSIGTTTCECSPENNPDDYYEACFGIIRDQNKPRLIKLKVYGVQVDYIRSQPLHGSQEEIETTDNYAVFSYFVRPSFDFLQKILWNRETVEILEPQEVRSEIKNLIEQMLNKYLVS
jgi:predicted DNA-binding transcriptional regulator YafY